MPSCSFRSINPAAVRCFSWVIERPDHFTTTADVRVAIIPEKHHADFLALLQDPVFTEEADATQRMVTTMPILHHNRKDDDFSLNP
jgi:hypothetical protein